MQTEGILRSIHSGDTTFILLFSRAGIAARGREFLDFLDDHANDGWEWSPIFSLWPEGRTKKDILDELSYIERYTHRHQQDKYVGRISVNIMFQVFDKSRYRRGTHLVIGEWPFFPLEDEFISGTIDFNEKSNPKEVYVFEKMVEFLQPHLGLVYRFELMHGLVADLISKGYDKKIDKIPTSHVLRSPWKYYFRTMLFGPKLVESYGREYLLNAPAYRILDMPNNSLLMHGPGGFYDVERLDVEPIDAWRNEHDILFEYDGDLAKYLGLTTDLMHYMWTHLNG